MRFIQCKSRCLFHFISNILEYILSIVNRNHNLTRPSEKYY